MKNTKDQAQSKSVEVYTTETCPYCTQVKQFLDENDVEYEEVDVSESEEGREEMVEKSDQMGVPVVDIDGEIIIGFDKEKIKKALDL